MGEDGRAVAFHADDTAARMRWLAPGSSFFPQQRLKRAAQQLAEGGGDSLPVAGLAVLEPAEALHEIKVKC